MHALSPSAAGRGASRSWQTLSRTAATKPFWVTGCWMTTAGDNDPPDCGVPKNASPPTLIGPAPASRPSEPRAGWPHPRRRLLGRGREGEEPSGASVSILIACAPPGLPRLDLLGRRSTAGSVLSPKPLISLDGNGSICPGDVDGNQARKFVWGTEQPSAFRAKAQRYYPCNKEKSNE